MSVRFCAFRPIIQPAPNHLVAKLLKTVFNLAVLAGFFLAACNDVSERAELAIETQAPHLQNELSEAGMVWGAPIFIRIVKSTTGAKKDGYLELFVEREDGQFQAFRRWDICAYSGDLGPKLSEGDGQSPEGFYFVKPGQMNPNSSYHLSFNLGFPNAFDRAHDRTGSFLMVHGDCVSIGCYAMTDPVIEQIYALMEAAFDEGQAFIRVHIFPFEMSSENLEAVRDNPNYDYWRNLKEGWDWFEQHDAPPNVTVENRRYVFD